MQVTQSSSATSTIYNIVMLYTVGTAHTVFYDINVTEIVHGKRKHSSDLSEQDTTSGYDVIYLHVLPRFNVVCACMCKEKVHPLSLVCICV